MNQLSILLMQPSDIKREKTALAIGAFATTLTTLSLSLMEWRGVTTTNVYIGNFFFVAGRGFRIPEKASKPYLMTR